MRLLTRWQGFQKESSKRKILNREKIKKKSPSSNWYLNHQTFPEGNKSLPKQNKKITKRCGPAATSKQFTKINYCSGRIEMGYRLNIPNAMRVMSVKIVVRLIDIGDRASDPEEEGDGEVEWTPAVEAAETVVFVPLFCGKPRLYVRP
jgi:hypothetical protein